MVGTGKDYHNDQTNNMCRMEMNGVNMTRGEIGQLTGWFRVGSDSSTNDGLDSPVTRLVKMPRQDQVPKKKDTQDDRSVAENVTLYLHSGDKIIIRFPLITCL